VSDQTHFRPGYPIPLQPIFFFTFLPTVATFALLFFSWQKVRCTLPGKNVSRYSRDKDRVRRAYHQRKGEPEGVYVETSSKVLFLYLHRVQVGLLILAV
jgi:hypothetical protein